MKLEWWFVLFSLPGSFLCGGVLSSARTGLIFTGLQEGAQPGGRTQPQPGQTECSIPCAVMRGSGGEGGAAGTHSRLGSVRRRCGLRERVCFCGVFPLSVSLLLLLPLFAVLLKCPYPDPPVSACFFPFSSTPRRGEGRPRGAFVASGSRNQNRWWSWFYFFFIQVI